MEKIIKTGRWIDIDQDSSGYVVRLVRNGHEDYIAKGLDSFGGVNDKVIDMMTACLVGMESVAVPGRLLSGIPLTDCKGWVFANFCKERAYIKNPDALI